MSLKGANCNFEYFKTNYTQSVPLECFVNYILQMSGAH